MNNLHTKSKNFVDNGICIFGHRYSWASFEALWCSDMLVFNSMYTICTCVHGISYNSRHGMSKYYQHGIICQQNKFVWIGHFPHFEYIEGRSEERRVHGLPCVGKRSTCNINEVQNIWISNNYLLLHKF